MNDTVQKLMGLVQAYASDYAHALMVTGVGSDPRDSRQALEDELTRLFTPLTDEQIRQLCKESWVFDTAKQWVRIAESMHDIVSIQKQDHEWTESTKIVGVAIKYNGTVYSLPAPNRHHNVIRHIREVTGDGIKGSDVQGFITNDGEFLNRKQAILLATLNGQMNRGPGGYQGPELFSEDLW